MVAPSLQHVTSADGTAIALEQVTEGPRPLVTFPGATAGRANWSAAAERLDGSFEVWLADRRGKGDSGDTEPYSFERESEDVRAVAAWFGGAATIAAHSSGAVCVLAAAASGELPAASLVLYEPPWPLPGRADYSAALDAMDARLAAGDPEGVLETGMVRLVEAPPSVVEAMKQTPSWPLRVAQAHTWPREGRALLRMPEGTAVLRSVGLRTVMLLGEQSAEHLRASTAAVAEALPHAEVVVLSGQGHAALQTAPELVADAILRRI
ncbi:alpha/beta fold hydrolase [Actinomycetospora flava]|uniref:Alpha/beta hydrolase n=1 Tax=Actinomycetospora flava TaxID=3129232 RepID=A0ABU8M093_9PSEU